MRYLRLAIFFSSILALSSCGAGDAFVIKSGDTVSVRNNIAAPGTRSALGILEKDLATVLSAEVIEAQDAPDIVIALYDDPVCGDDAEIKALEGKHEGFVLKVLDNGILLVAGSDPHGAAYGLMELSGQIGVSPWEWWEDSPSAKISRFSLKKGFSLSGAPSVAYRGIFINDEDFALIPWNQKHFDPSLVPAKFGPEFNKKLFELLLRLKANTYWPAMHGRTEPFFMTEGNREVAEQYGIYIGTSHCEPMASNANGEWSIRGEGEYNFISNRENVLDFWRERVEETASQEIIYTIGMRGIHDGPMAGATTPEEQKDALSEVIKAQREMLSKCLDKQVPQVFIPYKEVLLAYNEGLEVPEDVTLMWCDDNYGYIRHFPTEEEAARPGGNGIYYHVSYWGRPHDYLWLGTFSSALLYQQMSLGYEKGIRNMWIVNGGDIKPAEYQIELFLDMAWDIDGVRREGWAAHLEAFLTREFGPKVAKQALPILKEHYRLAYIRKPEFMGNTREEESDPGYRIVKDLAWDEGTIRSRMDAYSVLYDKVEALSDRVPAEAMTSFYQLVQYPVQAAAKMNEKALTAQLARHGLADWAAADAAYDDIMALTDRYNAGKWDGMMNAAPRNLPVFSKYPHETLEEPLPATPQAIASFNAIDCVDCNCEPCEGLGYEGGAAVMVVGKPLEFVFSSPAVDAKVSVHLVPTHPVSSPQLRFSLSVDGDEPQVFAYETYDRSEEWKESVLNNQAVREMDIALPAGKHTLKLTALDEGEVLDRIIISAKDGQIDESQLLNK